MVEPLIPVTSPIIEEPIELQQSENTFNFNVNNTSNNFEIPVMQTANSEIKMPEPIIITDYSKQYDPVMPQYISETPALDFKEAINAIRECSKKIEQFGFKIDVEEIDLANLYQVVFKIDKN